MVTHVYVLATLTDWVLYQYCPSEGSEQKMGQNIKLKRMRYSLAVYTIWFVSTSWSFWCGRMSKSDKNGKVMPIQSWGKSGVLAYFGLQIGYFGHIFWDMDFKFDLPIIYINIKGIPN